ncbi:MAG: T9SS type A sorting domain-containing protein [Bacteroidales bacterium]|nr:T9SS type A sorting domain-containing protein [Bacteroidales bacterium]
MIKHNISFLSFFSSVLSRFLPVVMMTLAGIFSIETHAAAAQSGNWRLYPSFDNDPERIIATPFGAYFFGLAQAWRPAFPDNAERQGFLYRYDKDAEEFEFLSDAGPLSETLISTVEYNPVGGYLVIVYTSYNIDLVYDDGHVVNIPGLKDADISSSRQVNDITFDYDLDRIYLATDFGYVVLNAAKGEVDRSFIINEPVESVARLGNDILLLKDDILYAGDSSRHKYTMDDFENVADVAGAVELLPVSVSRCALKSTGEDGKTYYRFINLDGWSFSDITNSNRDYVEYAPEGFIVGSGAQFIYVKGDGVADTVTRQESEFNTLGSTRDMREFWFARGREGVFSKRFDRQADTKWSLTRGAMMPDASSAYRSSDMVWHPDYGLLVSNHGIDLIFESFNLKTPVLLSALDRGRWVRLGLPYVNPSQADVLYNPNGLAVDPDNSDLIYFGSIFNGILRMNLADPSDILHLASPYDPTAGNQGYVQMGPGNPWWPEHFKFSAPRFDSAGNMWSAYFDSQTSVEEKNPQGQLWFWAAADRKASKNAASFRPWNKLVIEDVSPTQMEIVYPLVSRDAKNTVVYAPNEYGAPIIVLDHKGTLDNSADDEMVKIQNPSNQDGTVFELERVSCVYEDTDTGLVWVGTTTGLFTFDPVKIMQNPTSITNIKVSREDGTDLADYLFNGSHVTDIISDPQGRKWFSLNGGGVVCTSADGRRVLLELTTGNSLLPSDIVYSLCWNNDNNSVMMSTASGLAEYFPSGVRAEGEDSQSVRAYPNPVHSDYFGYVTIDGLNDNALVKIVDTHGNLVKEFDLASGGEVKWDVTNLSHKRVKTGVYYILASSGPDGTSFSNVGKVLVVN